MWRKANILLALLLGLGSLCGPVLADNSLRGSHPVVWKDFLGVNAQFQYFDPGVYQKQMNRLDALGLNWVRLAIHWAMIEPSENNLQLDALDGAMNAMHSHQYNILAYMVGSAPFAANVPNGATPSDQYPPKDFNVFAQRMQMLALRYPQVNTWQVWNEPNIVWLPKEDPNAYDRLLNTTTSAIRTAIPDKPVATAGMAYYSQMRSTQGLMLKDLLEQGLGSENLIAAYHPYSEFPEGDDAAAKDFLVRGNFLNNALHSRGVQQVWATEWGWSSYTTGAREMQAMIGLNGQADYTLRRLALMATMDYQRIFLFNLSDLDARASNRDQSYGLVDLSGEPKPVYNALKYFLDTTGPSLIPDDPPTLSNAPNDLYSIAWTRPNGSHVWMFWSASGSSLQVPGLNAAVLHDPLAGTQTNLSGPQGLSVPLKTSLQLLEW
ncbi:cellulase family glycosylhydrolase [Pseudomonas sp. Fl4BN1]|uniref:cellulase family glycosylhydrolase n=1 Tax=Pseudomonas sp. Fl4BN1 TaxID=2697651 RepID=UPI0013772DAB|nr:cellulase family glycosylhydrolase [Pseudomonas sp. Fl4BN1]NBF10443.1 cellulase family glycosylhydrolase [Pseudomonas sp. Fl4BN1]